ncbi:hypothetical protein, partial [Proteus mirabilis]|uniref:hypothetical protein n=1 Tax=Proteus mirabilis TaxID=584 RepID=UPI0034D63A52
FHPSRLLKNTLFIFDLHSYSVIEPTPKKILISLLFEDRNSIDLIITICVTQIVIVTIQQKYFIIA